MANIVKQSYCVGDTLKYLNHTERCILRALMRKLSSGRKADGKAPISIIVEEESNE